MAAAGRVCIRCNFLDLSASECVAVVYQRVSWLSSSGLMNIESSHKLNRSGDTAYGCIERVNLEQYQVGVVGGTLLMEELRTSETTEGMVIKTSYECKTTHTGDFSWKFLPRLNLYQMISMSLKLAQCCC